MNHGRFGVLAILISLSLASVVAQAKDAPAVAGEYVLKLKAQNAAKLNPTRLERTLGAKFKSFVNKDLGLIVVQRPMVESRQNALAALKANSMVEVAEPNFIYRASGGSTTLPNDPELNNLWGMINSTAGYDIDAKRAWEIETGSRDVIVAVIDTGVDYNYPDLANNMWTNDAEKNGQAGVDDDQNGFVDDVYGYDFAANDADPMDVYGHGTHCSGTIGAQGNNNIDLVGVAWNVRIMAIRFLGDDGGGTLEGAVRAIDYSVKMGAHISSNSWGGDGRSDILEQAIQRARDANRLFIAAAGNNGRNTDLEPTYPGSYGTENIISVAAINSAGAVAGFSNTGRTTVDVAAPGVDILSRTMRGLERWDGTSMATPHVSGIAALLLSQDMSQPYDVIKTRIMASARPIGSLRGKVGSSGLVNAYYALTNTVAPADPNDPYSWDKSAQTAETPHPYTDNFVFEQTFTVPGAQRVALYFTNFVTEAGYDKVEIQDANGVTVQTMEGNLGETFSMPVAGDTVKIRFTTDSSVTDYGFQVGGVAYQ